MIRILSLALALAVILSGCGIDGEPLIPPAKSTKSGAALPR